MIGGLTIDARAASAQPDAPAPRAASAPKVTAPMGRFLRQVAVVYAEPVDAPVVDRFRPPSTPYGPGNRGWEYATESGQVVRAAADGTVSFASAVGGSTAVTIGHADGLRTSYSYLEATSVGAGAQVRRGDPIGRSGARLHFGVRRGDVYLDPAILFAPPALRRVRLVPLRAS